VFDRSGRPGASRAPPQLEGRPKSRSSYLAVTRGLLSSSFTRIHTYTRFSSKTGFVSAPESRASPSSPHEASPVRYPQTYHAPDPCLPTSVEPGRLGASRRGEELRSRLFEFDIQSHVTFFSPPPPRKT
jgi:hypothetical protein